MATQQHLTHDDDEMLPLQCVAKNFLHVSVSTVKKLIQRNGLPVRWVGGSRRVRVSELRQWIRQTPEQGA